MSSATGSRDLAAALADDLDRAFPRLVESYQHRLYAFVLNLVREPSVAEDVAQATFVAAYHALRGYAPARRRALAVRAWLYTIALNRVRNRGRERTVPAEPAAFEGVDDPSPGPAAALERDETARLVRAALARLPARFRVPVVLRHVEGRSYAEIAQVLGQPEGTVKANVHRGLAQLKNDQEMRNLYAA